MQAQSGFPPVAELLPHRAPLLLLDSVLAADEDRIRVAVTVRDQAPFGDGGGHVPAYVGVEYMAQTACVYSGLELRRQGQPPKIGLLFGVRLYQSEVARFEDGQHLQVSAQLILREDSGLAAFKCEIFSDEGASLAQAEIKAFRPDDINEYLSHA
ncbi:MAG: 3-hydroxylacyl-ACP dehydratase [Pseudomonadota bacterium]